MKGSVWVLSVLLATLPVQGYVLLTANVEDLHAIAQRVIDSSMANQVNNILRRASTVFAHHVNRADDDESFSRTERRSEMKPPVTNDMETIPEDQLPHGKNVSVFLRSIKKIFENV